MKRSDIFILNLLTLLVYGSVIGMMFWVTFALMGCSTMGTERLNPDMSREDVLKIMHRPTSTEWDGRVEGLYYAETEERGEFCVKLYRNRVLVYGPYACKAVTESTASLQPR